MKLDSALSNLAGLGPKTLVRLEKLGLKTVRDLLFYFPRRYEDYTQISKIGEIDSQAGGVFSIRGDVLAIANKKTRRRGFTVTEAMVTDATGSIKVVWFNQPYLAKMLLPGSQVILNGKINFDYFSHGLVMESPTRTNYPKIIPVYGETEGLSSFFIAKLFGKVKSLISEIEEWLPPQFTVHSSQYTGEQSNDLDLLPIREAVMNIHEPRDSEMLEKARRRLAFDELFMIALQSQLTKEELRKQQAQSLKIDIAEIKKFLAGLPFELTGDQKKAIWAIVKDIEQGSPMNRLLSGDVGSGKTVVAAAAALVAVKNGAKAAILVPTSILAGQHFETFCQLFKSYDITIGIVTAERKDVSQKYRSKVKSFSADMVIEQSDILIGTHALIQPGVEIENLALTIVDEQHRFGVRQREALKNSSQFTVLSSQKMHPHFLSMTATPIPRTLYLALFGDLDVSVIAEKPANRKPVKTRVVDAFSRDKAYRFIRELIKAGRQVFVVCPLIEDKSIINNQETIIKNDSSLKYSNTQLFEEDRKAVKSEAEKLAKIFPEFKIATLHGRMKAKEKDEIMAEFSAGSTHILVSTSVVEVGVDVPNAAVMVIEDAERFGLATIHQFRGRVGRSQHQSFCFLFSSSQSDRVIERLTSLEQISDGFKLAEIDLATRGFGSILGTEQSGVLDMKMADFSDKILIEQASEAAKKVVADIETYPKLKERAISFQKNSHLE